MKKTDKKHERDLSLALTKVCDDALKSVPGFAWITHFVNYGDFPRSLIVVCVFETDEQLRMALATQANEQLSAVIEEELQVIGIELRDQRRQLRFDTEEACERDNQGNWQQRYQSRNQSRTVH
jgi:hypothetical protein